MAIAINAPHQRRATNLTRLLRFIRIAVIGCMLLFAATSLFENRADLIRRFNIIVCQDRCMNQLLPADTVVARVDLDNFPYALESSAGREFCKAVGGGASGMFRFNGDLYFGVREGRIFLHARTSAAGVRIVCVDFENLRGAGWYDTQYCAGLCVSVIKPGTMSEDPVFSRVDFTPLYQTDTAPYASELSPHVLEITAGQPDENDPAVFTIPVSYYGQHNIMRFRLNDDGKSVTLISVTALTTRESF